MIRNPDERVERLFAEAGRLGPDERRRFLERECTGDAELRGEVESLLAHGAAAEREGILEKPYLGDAIGLGKAQALAARAQADAGSEILPAGRSVGDFRITREVGRGGMGVVYEAEQISLKRTVALKVLPAHLTLDERSIRRFRREAQTAARLRHPGIVEIHTVGEQDGTYYFAMEMVEGTPLDNVIRCLSEKSPAELSGEAFAEALTAEQNLIQGATDKDSPSGAGAAGIRERPYLETVCRVVAQVTEALAYAHENGVIHRDVKPSNIIVRSDGSAVLTDFGLARPESPDSLTSTGRFAGTPAYVSPEQAQGKDLDHRSDLFSLGATLYELLTLRRAFDGPSSAAVLSRIVARAPPLPRRLNPLVPRDLETICLTALEKDTGRRYQSADEMAADLQRFLEYRPVKARPVGRLMRTLRWVRRNPVAAAAIIVPLMLTLGGSTGFGLYQMSVNATIRTAQQRAKKEQAVTLASNARLAAQRGQWADALEMYDRALDGGYPDPIELKLARVEALLGQFDNDQALEELESVTALPDLGRHLSKALLLRGFLRAHKDRRLEAGIEFTHRALEEGGLDAADRALAQASLATNLPQQERLLEEALEADPFHHEAHVALAHLLVLMGRFEEARECGISLEAKYPDDPVALFVRGLCALLEEETAAQGEQIRQELEAGGWTAPAHNLELFKRAFQQGRDLDRVMSQGLAAAMLSSSRLGFLIEVVPMVLRQIYDVIALQRQERAKDTRGPNIFMMFPPRVEDALQKTAYAMMTGTLSSDPQAVIGAIEDLGRAIAAYPMSPLYFCRGFLKALAGRPHEAELDLNAASQASSPIPFRRAALLAALVKQREQIASETATEQELRGACLRATRTILSLLEYEDLNVAELHCLADSAVRAGDLDLANQVTARWRRQAPRDLDPLVVLAGIHSAQSAYGLALRESEAALDLDPGHEGAHEIHDRAAAALRELASRYEDSPVGPRRQGSGE